MRPTALSAALLVAALPAQNQAIQLQNGVDGSVDVPWDPMLMPPTGLTVEAWITYDDATIPTGSYRWPTIARLNPAPQSEVWFLRVPASNTGARSLQFSVRDVLATSPRSVFYNFAPGEFAQWTHVAATYDGPSLRLYKNGQQVALVSLTVAREISGPQGMLRIGNGDAAVPGNETWHGSIDELRIWPFARTAAEIQATMNQSLSTMPGKVLTWNLDGGFVDSSRGLIGSQNGAVAFVPGAPGLVAQAPFTLPAGPSTTNCPRTIDTHLGSLPLLGNGAFAIWCTQGPLPSASPFGLAVAAWSVAPPGQPPVLGLQPAFALGSVAATLLLIPPTNALGNVRLGLPIPPSGVTGLSLLVQFGFADAACGPQGFTASDAFLFVVF